MGCDFIQRSIADFRKILSGYLSEQIINLKKSSIFLVNVILFRGDVVLHQLHSLAPCLPV